MRDILRAAKPHWRPIALAFVLMAAQSLASTARVVLFLPIFTRVLAVDADKAEDAEAREQVQVWKKQTGPLYEAVDGLVETVNKATARLVPDSWVEDVGAEEPEAKRARMRAQERDRYATLASVMAIFLVVIAVMCGATYGETYLAHKAQLRILMDVRESVCRKIIDQPVSFFDGRKQGELVQRVLGEVGGYGVGLTLVFMLVRTTLNLAVPFVALIVLAPKLMLFSLIAVPFLLPLRSLSMRTLKRSHKRQQQSARLVEVLLQVISGVRIVKAFGTEEPRAREFRATDEEVTRRSLKVQRAKSMAGAMTTLLNNLMTAVMIVGGGWLIMQGAVSTSPGTLIVFSLLLATMYQPIKRIVKHYNNLLDSMASVERTTEYLNLPEGAPDTPDAVAFPGLRDSIRFEAVGFAYGDGNDVLQDITFEIPKGATVALVGPSGAGKSTLCDLLLRFYDPSEGRITIDGKDARSFLRASYLARTAVVTQTPFLFHTTIRENIRQGKLDVSDEAVEAAARAAFIHDDIVKTPNGYDEEVGDQGIRLSGGQRQRITIARALVRDPEILVLDEATSSLDTASEQAVQRAVDSLRAGRTTLVVAHRLSTIRNADRIIVMSEGRIVEQGSHEELIGRSGLYAGLVELQDVSARGGEGGAL